MPKARRRGPEGSFRLTIRRMIATAAVPLVGDAPARRKRSTRERNGRMRLMSMVRDWCRAALLMSALVGFGWSNLFNAAAAQTANIAVWFNPAPESADFQTLFTQPDSWSAARKQISVFEFAPSQLRQSKLRNSLEDMVRVDAFQKLRSWGIQTAIAVGAVKEWDCNARTTVGLTVNFIRAVHQHGGAVQYVAMDEPLFSGLGLNKPICNFTIEQAATRTADFAQRVQVVVRKQGLGAAPAIVDIEPYPSISLSQHETWIDDLIADGLRPAAYQLDIAIAQINRRPEIKQKFVSDLRQLKAFVESRNIPFGVIVWSSHDPVGSDREYFQDTLEWARTLHNVIGRPNEIVLSSWVRRCNTADQCDGPRARCASRDPSDCGKRSVPTNIPDSDPSVFSHTRLILETLAIFQQP